MRSFENGKTGLLIPPKDANNLAAAIRSIIEDNDLYERVSINVLKKYQEISK